MFRALRARRKKKSPFADKKQKTGDLMEGGNPPRDCKQSLRPYNRY